MSLANSLMKGFLNTSHRVEINGLDKLDFSEPTILMPNHTSLADAAILAFNLPENVTFVVNTDTAKKYAKFLQFRKHITVDPLNPYSVRKMIRVVNSGTPLMIFPEGRITVTGSLMKVYSGTGYIALKTKAKVYPVIISGLDRSKFSYMNEVNETVWFPKVKINIGNPFKIEVDDNMSMREKKNKSADDILHILQNEKFKYSNKENVNLFDELLEARSLYGEKKPILEDLNSRMTYKDLLLQTYVVSGKLDEHLKEEQTIGLFLPNTSIHAVVLFSLFKIGKTPAVLNFSMGPSDLADCLDTANVKVVVTSKEFIKKGKLEKQLEAIEGKAKVLFLEDFKNLITTTDKLNGLFKYKLKEKSNSKSNEVILFTSGSESKPKGVILTHDNLYANIKQAMTFIDFTQKDKLFNALPMFHSFGLTIGTFLPILSGLELFLYPSPLHSKVIPEVSYRFKSTILLGTSTFLHNWGKQAHRYDFFSVRYIFAGAEAVKQEVRDLWFKKFQKPIFEGYGATEASPIVSINSPLFHKDGSVGQILPGIEYKIEKVDGIEDGGNLFIKGPNVMKGYLIHGKGFVPAEEWYNTGDVVSIDSEGYIFIKSRLKRFAKIAGEMVSLNKVEELAGKYFNSPEFAAINVPDVRKGEKIVVFTTNEELDIKELRRFITEQGLSALLAPAEMRVIKDIPALPTGKTNYISLKEKYLNN